MIVLLALVTLEGCQGLSAGPSSTHPTQGGTLALSTSALNFGSVVVGSSNTLTLTATNSGSAALTVTGATASAKQFVLNAPSLPLTIAAGHAATLSIAFTPEAAANVAGTISIVSNASDSSLSVSLNGVGVAPGQLTSNTSSMNFGTVVVGKSQTESATLTNTGGSNLTISQASVTGSGFQITGLNLPLTLTSGQSTKLNVTFAPQSSGAANGTVSLTANPSMSAKRAVLLRVGSSASGFHALQEETEIDTLTISVTGLAATPGLLGALPSSLNFGSVQVGDDNPLSESVTNTGGSDVIISQVNVTGAGFGVSGINPPVTLTPGQTYTFTATFAPQSAGSASGSITVVSNASNPNLTIPLSGTATATAQLSVNPAGLNFGNVVVGTNSQLGGQLNATGASVTVSSVVSSNSQYTVSGLSLPVTIPAGSYATFTVTFTPTATGLVNATLTFTSNATNSPTVQSLSGTGTAPPVHSVALSWDASSSPDIAGYNIYRSTVSGGPYTKINSSLDSTTSYTDNSVVDGTTYYYVTTAVNSSNQESGYSNQASATIPPP